MSEQLPRDAVEKKRRKPSFRIKMALLQVIERKRLEDRVDYKAISARTGVSAMSLRQLWVQWKRGEIDLGDPETPEERVIDARAQHGKRLNLLQRYEGMVLNSFDALILKAEDAMTKDGGTLAWQELGLPSVVKELKSISAIRSETEKGYAAILDDIQAARRREEKPINGSAISVDVETKIVHANDEARALAVLDMPTPRADG